MSRKYICVVVNFILIIQKQVHRHTHTVEVYILYLLKKTCNAHIHDYIHTQTHIRENTIKAHFI